PLSPACRDLAIHFASIASLKFHARAIPASTAEAQAMRQRLRQARLSHAFLDLLEVVGHTPELYHLMLQVGDGKTRARIGVARLPDRSGVQKVALLVFHAQRAA